MSVQVPKGYKQTEVGVIPEDWHQSTVGAEFEIKNNLRLPLSSSVRKSMAGDFPYYGPTGIQGYINEFRVEGEFALIGEDGDHFLKWNERPMTQMVRGKFNVNNHAHIVLGVKNETQWFYYYFYNRDITSFLTRQGANRYKLTKKTLLDLPCAIPESKKEQQAIAEALSDADALIESLEQLIAKKRQIKQGAMQDLLTGQRRLPGFSGEWILKSVRELGEVITGGTPSTARADFWGGTIPWVTPTDIQDERDISITERSLTVEGAKEIKLLPGNTVLVTCIASIGKNAILRTSGASNQQINAVIPSKESSAEFLFYLFEFNKSYLQGNAGTTATSILSKANFQELVFSVPQMSEQLAIAQFLSDIDSEISGLVSQLQKSKKIKQAMMQELLTGRIRLI